MTRKIILASQSLLRGRALDILGLTYEKIPSHFDETSITHSNHAKRAQLLAEAKAKKIAVQHNTAVIIAGDLFVICNDKVFEKPPTLEDAKRMLHELSNKEFTILSGLAVLDASSNSMHSTTEVCKVKFRELTEHEIADYCTRYPVTKFAAAFDGDGMLRFAEHVEGNYNFYSGLPVNRMIEFLRACKVNV